VITYLAINLTNKKFQVGSTKNFARRCREHHSGKGDLEFQRSLRKNPENFYWVVSEDDGLETRDEEQYYLDFYQGTVWCYNHNPLASVPPSHKGTGGPTHFLSGTKHSDERRDHMSNRMTGVNNPFYGKKHTEEGKQKIRQSKTGKKGGKRSEEAKQKMRAAKLGKTGELCPLSRRCEVIFPDGSVKVYPSSGEASKGTGIPKSTITRWARKLSKPAGKYEGYSVRYVGGAE